MPLKPASAASKRRFCLVLVKPTHYCDDGYPIRWFRSAIPSNSLACIYGIAKDCGERHVLGDDVEIDIHAIDEANTRIRPQHIAGLIKAAGDGMVLLVGVQSNQTPRALDIARPLRQAGIKVAIGGFHMSGVIAMIDGEYTMKYLRRSTKLTASNKEPQYFLEPANPKYKPIYPSETFRVEAVVTAVVRKY